MIKFRCGNCNQKLGVDGKYAGRRVRCNKCKEPVQVPPLAARPAIAIEAPPAETAVIVDSPIQLETNANAPQPEQADLFDGFDLQSDNEDAQRMEAIQVARRDRVAKKTRAVKYSGQSPKEKKSCKSDAGGKEGFSMMSFADIVPPVLAFPLSLVACLLAIVATIGIWIVCSRAVGTGLGIFVLIVPVASAFGLRLFMVNRTILLGMLGLIIGLAGIGVGKVAIAKYVIKDYYQKISNEEILVDLDKILADAATKSKGQTKSVKPYARNGGYAVCTVLISLVDTGEVDPVKARGWMLEILNGASKPTAYDQLLGNTSTGLDFLVTDEQGIDEDKMEIISKAYGMAFQWEEDELLLQNVKKYFPALQKLIIQSTHQKILADPDKSFKFCLFQAFGVLDIIWVLLGMTISYIILTFD